MSGPLRPSRLLLALMLATLTGCAQLPLGRAPSPEQIDRWVAQHEYGRALEAIDRLPKDDPAAAPLRERRSEIVRQARAYAERRMEAAERHRRKGEWETAFETLYEARRNYPFSKRLGEVLRALERAQHERIAEIERKLALLRTEWQVRAVPLREELARVDAYNRTAEWELEQAREAVAQSFGGLRRCGLEALEAGDLDIAARCLELARRIRPTPRIEAALTQVHERQRSTREARERQQAQAREARERARAEALLAEGRQALDSQDVRAARNVLV
ncbi:MAG: hypothetical protein GWN84_25540, partial [Gammaproteobacteria bacterium]|nr:hypothetical protein [Gammaproteobacteria bacterium]NIR85877.1 hypothetical protein [Gammaproteobacteria bacterium]NIR90844.1 hypothetical protein [Gammaproteobacteria bacterium]